MAKYRLSPAAERDLESIWIYTFQQWGLDQADRYADLLIDAFAELALRPKMAPACDHIRPGYRRCKVGQHIVYFRVTNDGVDIIRVLHSRMDAARQL